LATFQYAPPHAQVPKSRQQFEGELSLVPILSGDWNDALIDEPADAIADGTFFLGQQRIDVDNVNGLPACSRACGVTGDALINANPSFVTNSLIFLVERDTSGPSAVVTALL
jgi:hypothetical protein